MIFALLLTVLLRDTLFSPRANAALLQEKLQGAGATVTLDQARGAARMLSERLWDWHVYLGYGLAALVVLRAAVLLVDRPAPAPAAASTRAHYRAVKLFHQSFYVALVVMVGSGLVLAFGKALALGKPTMQVVHGVHENLMWYVIGFIVLHVAGVVRAEHREDAGIVSEMIHGGGERR